VELAFLEFNEGLLELLNLFEFPLYTLDPVFSLELTLINLFDPLTEEPLAVFGVRLFLRISSESGFSLSSGLIIVVGLATSLVG
jgi:hypothetical protein